MKLAIAILSDPRAGDESFGRLFNALAVAHEAQQAGDEVEVVFNGAGSRWPAELTKPGHPANALYNSVRESVRGVSHACSAAFGATDSARNAGMPLLADKALVGTPGLSDIRRYVADGWRTIVF